jgi:molybdopterin molybdotransferase
MSAQQTLLGADEAARIIHGALAQLPAVRIGLHEALGRVLAEEIIAGEPVPPFDNAAMDGFAVRTGDLPGELRIAGSCAAGTVYPGVLGPGEAVRIMTGAVVPAGADAVVQQEWTGAGAPGAVTVARTVPAGHNIRRAGADLAAGTRALGAGTLLRPQEIGLLASIGRSEILAARRPSAALLTTGDELAVPGVPLGPGMIHDSNAPMLAALLAREGCDVVPLGVARDDREELRARITSGLGCDLLVTAGGVSVGDHDHVGEILRSCGVEILFWKVNIRPGMPLLFGRRGSTAVFGLPGNPVSAMVTCTQFIRPAIRRLTGAAPESGTVRLRARLAEEIVKQDGKRHFVRGILSDGDGAPVVRSTGSQVSNVLSSLVRANCLIILPEEGRAFPAGTNVEVELL